MCVCVCMCVVNEFTDLSKWDFLFIFGLYR